MADSGSPGLAVGVVPAIREDTGPPDLVAGESFAISFSRTNARSPR
jgi:hypothetical protein